MILEPKVGDRIRVNIVQIDTDGDGVAIEGEYIIYVPDTFPGQCLTVQINRINEKIIYAEIMHTHRGVKKNECKDNQDNK